MHNSGGVAVFLCFCSVISWSQPDCSGKGQIEGVVLDAEGRSLVSAKVSILSEECAVIGVEPTATTDDQGHFLLRGVPIGLNGVYAQKPEDGYPDTTAAIYLDASVPPPKVTVRSAETVTGVVVRLGTKAGLLSGEVVDKESSQPVVTARVRISIPDNERIMLSMGVDRNGRFQLLLPARPVSFVVSAPGYNTWNIVDGQPDGVIRLQPEERRELSIKLYRQKN
jgi:Carboxypeptidase regulatory-like domain